MSDDNTSDSPLQRPKKRSQFEDDDDDDDEGSLADGSPAQPIVNFTKPQAAAEPAPAIAPASPNTDIADDSSDSTSTTISTSESDDDSNLPGVDSPKPRPVTIEQSPTPTLPQADPSPPPIYSPDQGPRTDEDAIDSPLTDKALPLAEEVEGSKKVEEGEKVEENEKVEADKKEESDDASPPAEETIHEDKEEEQTKVEPAESEASTEKVPEVNEAIKETEPEATKVEAVDVSEAVGVYKPADAGEALDKSPLTSSSSSSSSDSSEVKSKPNSPTPLDRVALAQSLAQGTPMVRESSETTFSVSPVTPYRNPATPLSPGSSVQPPVLKQTPPEPLLKKPESEPEPEPEPKPEPKPESEPEPESVPVHKPESVLEPEVQKVPNRSPSEGTIRSDKSTLSKKPASSAQSNVKMTRAHSLRVADRERKVQVAEENEQKMFNQAKQLHVQQKSKSERKTSPSSPASTAPPVPSLQPHNFPQSQPPTLPHARYEIDSQPQEQKQQQQQKQKQTQQLQEATQHHRSRTTPTPKLRGVTSPVRIPRPVSPAGRYNAQPSDIMEGARRDTTARLKYKRDDGQVDMLQECIRQKEAAREERKSILANLNSFLNVYAGDSPRKDPKTPERDVVEWERRRVVGKALFTRSSESPGTVERGAPVREEWEGGERKEFPASIAQLRAESWRETVKKHKTMETEQKKTQGGSRLFNQGMELAREKKKWVDNERTKNVTKRTLEAESNLTFRPAIDTKSRNIEASLRRNTSKDHKTRLLPEKQQVVTRKSTDATQAFGRTTRTTEPQQPVDRSVSAPIPARVDKLAQPKRTQLIELVGNAFNELNGKWDRGEPIDEKLLAKRNHDMNGREVSQYLHGRSIEMHAKRTRMDKALTEQQRSMSNVGRYLTESSRDLAAKRRRERLEQLFFLLDVESSGKVTQQEISQADAALKSVRARISDPREASILKALTEAAEILSHDTAQEYTVDTFIEALENRIGKFGPMKFMNPDIRDAKPRPAPTFNPAISERSRRMATRAGSVVYNRLYDKAIEQQAKLREKQRVKADNETVGMSFKPQINRHQPSKMEPRRKQRQQQGGDDVLSHIDCIVGEAAAWLNDVGKSPAPQGRTPTRSPGRRSPGRVVRSPVVKSPTRRSPTGRSPRRSPGKRGGSASLSVSPPTPAQMKYPHGSEGALHIADLYTGRTKEKNGRTRSVGAPTETMQGPHYSYQDPYHYQPQQGQVVQFCDPLAQQMISPSRSPSTTPQGYLTQAASPVQPPQPAARPRKAKRRQPPPPQNQITMSSLRTASVTELAKAGRLLMQQQLEKHRNGQNR
eukprot:TRINITY_DN356_c1_g1_i1.p1 TRINITY_DN356_c1_g1~~TRINITY_DN356_c1_g1_i1.p1  ORF type:complete len:1314 (+),score=300.15 TRINITY_DN356_c1_g1_i1:39-3980(+)